jgi:hypothetical protein
MLELKDILIPLASAVVLGIVGYAVNRAINETLGRIHDHIVSVDKRLNDHVKHCEKIDKTELKTRLEDAEEEISMARRFNHWAANGLATLAAKAGVSIGQRPT